MFCFTIRDVLWLMVVVGMLIGWISTARRMNALEREFAKLRAEFKQFTPPGMTLPGGRTFDPLPTVPTSPPPSGPATTGAFPNPMTDQKPITQYQPMSNL